MDELYEILRGMAPLASMPEADLRQLSRRLDLVELGAGEVLLRQGDIGTDLYVVASGRLSVEVDRPTGPVVVATLGAGTLVGEVQAVIGGRRTATVRTLEPSRLYRADHDTLDALGADAPDVARRVFHEVSLRLRGLDLAEVAAPWFGDLAPDDLDDLSRRGEWLDLQRGDAVCVAGAESDAWYLVVTGELDVLRATDGKPIRRLGRGRAFGEVGLLTGGPRTATVQASRASQVVRFPRPEFEALTVRHPRLLRSVAAGLARSVAQPHEALERDRNIALLGAAGVDLGDAARRLVGQLSKHGRVLHLDPRSLARDGVLREGLPAGHPSLSRFRTWLDAHAREVDFIVFEVAESSAEAWVSLALAHADRVFRLVDGDRPVAACTPAIDACKRGVPITLALLHRSQGRLSGNAGLLEAHGAEDLLHLCSDDAHFGRWARLIARKCVSLALGGGGAKGFAHLGVVKAFLEAGVPIDAIGGVSMGAILGAQLARGLTLEEIVADTRRLIATRPFGDYTLPYTAVLRSKRIVAAAQEMFGDAAIEDVWLPFFCFASDLTTASMVMFDRGPIWEATRASGSLPGFLMPHLYRTHLLVDGGVINNLPADLVRQRFGGTVVACDAAPEPEAFTYGGEELPSGWVALARRLNPWQADRTTPTMQDLLVRTMMMMSYERTRDVQQQADVFVSPPLADVGTVDFHRMDEMIERGYRYALQNLERWNLPTA